MAEKDTHCLKLPGSVQLKQTRHQGRGLFTTKAFRCGEEIFRCKPYAVGVGARTREGLRETCHNCAKGISKGSAEVCDRCGVAAYCGGSCRDEARRVHLAECEGLREMEKRRPSESAYKPFSDSPYGYWPPEIYLLTARALNRKIMDGKSTDDWEISFFSKGERVLSSIRKDAASKELLLKSLRPLVLQSLTTDEMICDTFCKVSTNSAVIVSMNSSTRAVYFEFSLLNHSCMPNCFHEDDNGMKVVCLLNDVRSGKQLCISYILDVYRLLPGDFRRRKIEELFGFECKCDACLSEQEAGSEQWRLEQQKRRAVDSCPRETAELAMAEGVDLLTSLVPLQESRNWVRVADIANNAIEKYKKVLDTKNVILYLFRKALFEAYSHLEQSQEAIDMFRVVKKSMHDYELQRDVQQIKIQAAMCYSKLGRKEEGNKILRSINNYQDLLSSMMKEGRVDISSIFTLFTTIT